MEIAATIERIKAAVGPRGWIADLRDQEPYLIEARGLYRGATRLVVRPASTAEAAANLFAMMRRLDRPPFTGIAVMPIPEHGLGRAINDRLRRAAAPR